MCGGTYRGHVDVIGLGGLSPRVRGNLNNADIVDPSQRSIPACAGEPRRITIVSIRFWVYPRVCGGTLQLGSPSGQALGLSPRVRGNRLPCPNTYPCRGSIPACAGEPTHADRNADGPEVYPRVCGGTVSSSTDRRQFSGLSPRVRGNRSLSDPLLLGQRSIPACAGEPRAGRRSTPLAWVYPRVCGGTAENRLGQLVDPRSIPACAGEPRRHERSWLWFGVYPRVCGGTRLIHQRA